MVRFRTVEERWELEMKTTGTNEATKDRLDRRERPEKKRMGERQSLRLTRTGKVSRKAVVSLSGFCISFLPRVHRSGQTGSQGTYTRVGISARMHAKPSDAFIHSTFTLRYPIPIFVSAVGSASGVDDQ